MKKENQDLLEGCDRRSSCMVAGESKARALRSAKLAILVLAEERCQAATHV